MRTHNRRQFLAATLGMGSAAGLAGAGILALQSRTDESAAHEEILGAGVDLHAATEAAFAFGTPVRIISCHADPDVAQWSARVAMTELMHINCLMSLYRPTSQLVTLNRDGVLQDPHPLLVELLQRCRDLSHRTEGAFDVTVQPLWEVYHQAQREGRTPERAAIEEAQSCVDWRRIEITTRCIRLHGERSAITLNGAAQGFAADRAAAALVRHGVRHALIDAGEIRSVGSKSDGSPWAVGIQHPRREDAFVSLVELGGRCLATSGDYATSFTSDYTVNHLFDPQTGRSPVRYASVSVVASTATEADMLSTAMSVLAPEEGLRTLRSFPETDALIVFKDGRTISTDGFPSGSSRSV